jgi:hypothetical protein
MPGEKRALEVALAEYEAPPEEQQLELLGAPITPSVVELRAGRTGKIGRPPGSPNKRTTEMAAYLLSRYTSPLEVLAQIATAGVAELAASLNCSKLEALQEKRLAAIALKDHLHSKMPLAVDLTNHKVIELRIGDFGEGDPTVGNGAGDVLTLTATVIKDGKIEAP